MKGSASGGFSLVEVIVAIAVGSILLAGVTSLIIAGLRFFGIGNANAEVQNESQRVLNLVLDNIMEAEGICMRVPAIPTDTKYPVTSADTEDPETDGNTDCLLLGDLVVTEAPRNGSDPEDTYRALFRGNILAYIQMLDGKEINEAYLIELGADAGYTNIIDDDASPYDGYCLLADRAATKEEAAEAGLAAVRTFIGSMGAADRLPWLMGSHVFRFRIVPDVTPYPAAPGELPIIGEKDDFAVALPADKETYLNGDEQTKYYFYEPLTLRVEVGIAYPNNNRMVFREVSDSVAVRSRLKNIYVEVAAGAVGSGSIERKMEIYWRW